VPLSRASVGLVAGLTVLVALVAGGVTALALGPLTLDPAAVQRDVAAQFEQEHGVGVQLHCPGDMEIARGEVHRCTGTTSAREEITIEIRMTGSPDGAYTWVVV
jgi:hypothetical protein